MTPTVNAAAFARAIQTSTYSGNIAHPVRSLPYGRTLILGRVLPYIGATTL